MAARQQAKEPKASGKRGQTVGAVPKGKAAKGGSGGGGGGGTGVDKAPGRWHCKTHHTYIPTGLRCYRCFFEQKPLDIPITNRSELYDQSPLDAAESGVQMGVPEGSHTGEPVGQDRDATGAAAQGDIPKPRASGGPGIRFTIIGTGERYLAAGHDWASRLGITGDVADGYAYGFAYGAGEQDIKAANRTRAAIGATFLIGLAAGALLLGIAQAIYRG